jgi:23S rRNA (uridine2552-2'-O)-methyltransferase
VGKAWLKGRKHDRYYRAAKRQSYRSRSAIKLSQIDNRYGVFEPGDVVVDLGAAPGGWSQVARERIGPEGRVLAVDQIGFPPIEGVESVRGDFTEGTTQARVFEALRKPADVVLSDMAPHLSGHREYDAARSFELAEAARSFAVRALRDSGTLLVKVFPGEDYRPFVARLRADFIDVRTLKPRASSARSTEVFLLARGRTV